VSGATVQAKRRRRHRDPERRAKLLSRAPPGCPRTSSSAGRFATALTGARVEMNSLGFQKFDADNNLLVSITGTEALLTGIFKTAMTGRRIEIGSSGASGEINFYAPDGTRTRITSFSSGLTGDEAANFQVPITGLTGTAWNGIQVSTGQKLFAISSFVGARFGGSGSVQAFAVSYQSDPTLESTVKDRFVIDETNGHRFSLGSTPTLRLWISSTGLTYFDAAATQRMLVDATDTYWTGASGTTVPQVRFRKSDGYWLHGSNIAGAYQDITNDGKMSWHYGGFDGWVEIMSSGTAGGTSPRLRFFTDSNFGNMLTVTREFSSGHRLHREPGLEQHGLPAVPRLGVRRRLRREHQDRHCRPLTSPAGADRRGPVKKFRRKGGKAAR
jgi:hypothetical protein